MEPYRTDSLISGYLKAPGWHSWLSSQLLALTGSQSQGLEIEPCIGLSTESV